MSTTRWAARLCATATFVLVHAAGAAPVHAAGAADYTPSPQNVEARRWFQDAKFGLFVHWGVYSVLGDGEWVMNNRKLRVAEYERLPAQFNPTGFSAAEWVATAKAAGM